MKKLLQLFLVAVLINSNLKAQVLLNEVDPIKAHFVELYNSGPVAENLDCYTIVTLKSYTSATSYSFYVFNINASASIPGGGFWTIDGASAASLSSLSEWTWNGSSYSSAPVTPSAGLKIFLDGNSTTTNTVAFLFKNTQLVDAFGGRRVLADVQAFLNGLQSFNVPSPCTNSPGSLSINFSQLKNQTNVFGSSSGQLGNKTYSRLCNGPCYFWGELNDSKGLSNNGATCTATSQITPSWNFSSLTYTYFDNTQKETSQTNNEIVKDAPAYSLDRQTATVYVSLNSFVNAASQSININVWYDNDINYPQTNVVTSGDILYSAALINLAATPSLANYPVIIPVDPNRRIIIEISTLPGVCAFRTSKAVSTAAGALPAEISALKARFSGASINLNWISHSESNNKGFEVQRAVGNTNDFKTIGFVGSRAKDGNSQLDINYNFEDANIVSGQTHYYRLKQIDFDGKSSLSPIRSIKPGSIESNLNVYPNPSQGSVTVNTGSTSGKLNIFVLDNTGRVVNQYMNVSTSNTRISNLKKGLYTLKIVNTETGEQSAQRVVVQ